MMNKQFKEEIKKGLVIGLVYGLIFGLIYRLIGGLIGGLIFGLVVVLSITFITQLIGLITQHPEFVMNDLILSGLLIITIQVIGWLIVKMLEAHKKTQTH